MLLAVAHDPDAPPYHSRRELAHGPPGAVLEAVMDGEREGRTGRPKRAVLAWLREELAARVMDSETGEVLEAGRLVVRKARDLALEDALVAVKLTDMGLRAEEAAAQADDGDDGVPVKPRMIELVRRRGRVVHELGAGDPGSDGAGDPGQGGAA